MKPTKCPLCEQVFDKRPLLQTKAIHTAKVHGTDEAERVINEALETTHEEHAAYFDGPPNPIA